MLAHFRTIPLLPSLLPLSVHSPVLDSSQPTASVGDCGQKKAGVELERCPNHPSVQCVHTQRRGLGSAWSKFLIGDSRAVMPMLWSASGLSSFSAFFSPLFLSECWTTTAALQLEAPRTADEADQRSNIVLRSRMAMLGALMVSHFIMRTGIC